MHWLQKCALWAARCLLMCLPPKRALLAVGSEGAAVTCVLQCVFSVPERQVLGVLTLVPMSHVAFPPQQLEADCAV